MSTAAIGGTVERGLEPVRELFASNFERHDDLREIGAGLCVYRAGRPVVDLWGGFADKQRTRPWTADTMMNVWSTTKALTALCVATLVERGKLRYHDKVTSLWPAYGQNGKDQTLISQLLSHQAGLPGFDTPTTHQDLYDWELVTTRLAAQAPRWEPGTKNSYHAITFGYLAGELVRQATGLTPGRYLRQEIAGPLGADFYIGLPSELDGRVAEMAGPVNPPDLSQVQFPPEAIAALSNPMMAADTPNDPAWRHAEVPAANGTASARGAARIFAAVANGGELDGTRLLSPATIDAWRERQVHRADLLLGVEMPWANGVARNFANAFGPNPAAFGHYGWGGSFVSADPEAKVSISYTFNQMGPQLWGDPRAQALIDRIYACLGAAGA